MDDTLKIPTKFLDKNTGELNSKALLKSYLELEKKMTETKSSETKTYSNMPVTPKNYEVSMDHDLFDMDDELNEKMFEMGFSQEQAQLVYDMAAEKLIPMVSELTQEFETEKQMSRLEDKFGGRDKYKEVARQLNNFGRKNLAPEVLDALSKNYEGVMALYKMMESSEPKAMKEKSAVPASGDEALKGMVRDPKYWRDKDPAFVAKVTQAFQDHYGEYK